IREKVDFDKLERIRTERASVLHTKHWKQKKDQLSKIAEIKTRIGEILVNCGQEIISCDSMNPIQRSDLKSLEETAVSLMPWRKGPFRLFDVELDTEWRSDLKWNRIQSSLGNLRGKKILDVGCGNGYYMLRASAGHPSLVLGLDPSIPFLLQFEFIQHFTQIPHLQIELLGAENLQLFDSAFDIILCMGVLYHQKNPLQVLKNIYKAVQPGGFAVIESQIIPGCEPVALFPEDRYAKARNVFFIPTESCLLNWVKRAGFTKVETVSVEKTTVNEQRKTRWTTFESLEDFLDPSNHCKTIEGYPAPHRAAVKATRPSC
ncbi:MAG: tRNA 5-methoxyuridine(34)/uridine 5-oxyacetic acid(34) synthase CmoB, partial [Planctomycetota bacterium]|nr:tRNA 5-methoxyuridine(34)/uridine 5-oxyacetic acid(34) synthase CmoB [Planctomycetota bacterium]